MGAVVMSSTWYNNNLAGAVPTELGQLTALTFL
jgi:hypothetical protein